MERFGMMCWRHFRKHIDIRRSISDKCVLCEIERLTAENERLRSTESAECFCAECGASAGDTHVHGPLAADFMYFCSGCRADGHGY